MKKILLLKLLALVACLSSALSATAYNFSYTYNGKTLYYNILTNNNVEVTYVNNGGGPNSGSNVVTGAVTIPSTVIYNGNTYTVTDIGEYAFYHRSGYGYLTSISIPSTVTYINNYAFYDQSQLTSVTLPNNCNYIGKYAFYGCSSLTSITFPNPTNNMETWMDDYAFTNCTSLTTVNLGSKYDWVSDYCFANCTALKTVTGGSNVSIIGKYAFQGCSSINEFVIPDKVTYVYEGAFQNCTGMDKMTIGKSVTTIGDYAFDFQSIDDWQGYLDPTAHTVKIYCKSIVPPTLTSSTFPTNSNVDLNPYYHYTVEVPNPYALSLYQAAQYWNRFYLISTDVEYDFIYNGIYYLITDLNSRTCKVTNKFGGGAGHGTDYTTYTGNVTIPATAYCDIDGNNYYVTAIGYGSFDETPPFILNSPGEAPSSRGTQGGLKSVVIGNNVTTIEDRAFNNANGLTSVTLGTSVSSIGELAFSGCTSLATVICQRSTPATIQSSTFDSNHYSTVTVKVPSASAVNSYKAATYWKNFYLILPNGGELNYAANVSGGSINFTSTGTYPWTILSDGTRVYVQSSNAGVASSTSTLSASVTVPSNYKNATLTFDFKAWGEGTNYDKCIFSVDGTALFTYGARDNDWETYTATLAPGSHTLTWSYQKDSSVNPTGDYFAVDNVKVVNNGYSNRLYLQDAEAEAGQTITVPVYLENAGAATGIQFDVYLPSGFEVTDATAGERLSSNAMVMKNAYSGYTRVMIMTMSGNVVDAVGEGVICNLSVKVPSAASGEYELSTQNSVIAVNGSNITMNASSAVITVTGGSQPGDVNGDGNVNISDVTALIDILLNGGNAPASADVNGDNQVNIADVTALIDMLLGS